MAGLKQKRKGEKIWACSYLQPYIDAAIAGSSLWERNIWERVNIGETYCQTKSLLVVFCDTYCPPVMRIWWAGTSSLQGAWEVQPAALNWKFMVIFIRPGTADRGRKLLCHLALLWGQQAGHCHLMGIIGMSGAGVSVGTSSHGSSAAPILVLLITLKWFTNYQQQLG